MKLLKWTFMSLLTLAMLLLIAAIVLPRVYDPNSLKPVIQQWALDKTQRQLKINGDLRISVFPWLGVRVGGVELAQPAALKSDGEPFLTLDDLQLRVKLLPLLKRQVEVDTIVLGQPRIRMLRSTEGFDSLHGFLPGEKEVVENQQPATDQSMQFDVKGVEVIDGSLIYLDQSSDTQLFVDKLYLEAGALLSGEPHPLKASGNYRLETTAKPADFDLKALALLHQDSGQIQLSSIQGSHKSVEGLLDFTAEELDFHPDDRVDLRGISGTFVAAKNFNESLAELDVKYELAGLKLNLVNQDVLNENIEMRVTARMIDERQPISSSIIIPKLSFNLENQKARLNDIKLEGNMRNLGFNAEGSKINLDVVNASAKVDDLQLAVDQARFSINDLQATDLFDQVKFAAAIEAPTFDLRPLLAKLEAELEELHPESLKSVAFSGKFAVTTDSLEAASTRIDIDETEVKGSFKIRDFKKPRIEFDLLADVIDLDRFFNSEQGNTEQSPGTIDTEAFRVPMDVLAEIDANGRFRAAQFASHGVSLEDVDVRVSTNNGIVKVVPNARLYDGKLAGSMQFSQRGDVAELRIKNNIDLINLDHFLNAAGISDRLTGLGGLNLDLVITEQRGKQSNRGSIGIAAKDGALKGVDVKNLLDKGFEVYRSLKTPDAEATPAASDPQTRFAELAGTFSLDDFSLDNQDFDLKAPLFRVAGKGGINLAKQELNYDFMVSVVNSTEGQGGAALNELRGLSIPLRCRGAISSPNCSLDSKSLIDSLAKREIAKKKAEVLEEKLGIEDGGDLSATDILRQVLLDKVRKRTGIEDKDEETLPSPSSEHEAVPSADQSPQAEKSEQGDRVSESVAVPDVYSDVEQQVAEKEEEVDPEEKRKEKVLDDLFQ